MHIENPNSSEVSVINKLTILLFSFSLHHVILSFSIFSLSLYLLTNTSIARAEKLTIERLVSSPTLSGGSPIGLKFSPDGQRLAFLKPDQSNHRMLDLWEFDLRSNALRPLVKSASIIGENENISQVEWARRERMRITHKGIVTYNWSNDGTEIVFSLGGDLYAYSLENHKALRLTHSLDNETDSRFSPKSRYVSYIQNHNIHILDLKTNKIRVLTQSKKETIRNGSAEFVAMEEMGRHTGYWWSPDEKYIAYTQIDEAPVQVGERYEISRDSFKVLKERYPRAGTPNVSIKLAIMEVNSGRVKWIDLGNDEDIYLARVKWIPDSSGLFFQQQNREQTQLDLIFADTITGDTRTVLTETSDTWINLHHTLKFLKNGEEFIWASERSGFNHLYHYKIDGTLIGQLTDGQWIVTSLKQVDEESGDVYFTGHANTPIEHYLYKVNLRSQKNRMPLRVSQREGWHDITFPERGFDYIDRYSNPETPPQVSIHDSSGEHINWIEENAVRKEHPYYPYLQNHVSPEFGKIKGSSAEDLYFELYKPKNMKKNKKYPVIVSVYGGPRVQTVRKRWPSLYDQYLVQQGYIIFRLDNRGSSHRGVKFESAIHRHLGKVELEDQLEGIEYLKTLEFVDPSRIGIVGSSYGGYLTLMGMFKAPETFRAGISIVPVTDFRLYDTHYTERYLGHPGKNKAGYDHSSVIPYAKNLEGKLLVIHGMADDNVIFKNSSLLLDEMQKNSILFDYMAYPGEGHLIGSTPAKQQHILKTIERYFDDHL